MKKLLIISSILAIGAGIVMVVGGVWAAAFIYQNVAQEDIVTPEDASIPNTAVRGPLTLKSQADVIRKHALEKADGKTYAETPRQISQTDEDGNQVMVTNPARELWLTATTLITALHLGVITYLFSGLIILFGCISIWTGIVFRALSKQYS